MANPTPGADMFQTWKELYDQYETTFSQATQEMLASETFTKSLAVTREQYLSGRKVNKETMERYWESLRIPTKTDVARVAGLVNALENKIDALEDSHEALTAQLKRIESKLDALLSAPAEKAPAPKTSAPKAPRGKSK